MTDINNNFGTNNVSKIQNIGFDTAQSAQITPKNHADKEIKDLDKAHAALVGRSMVKKMPKVPSFSAETAEAIKADLAELQANPELVRQAVNITDLAMEKGIPYDKAIEMAREFVDFHK